MSSFDQPMFHDDEAARLYLEGLRWPEGPVCPHCGTIGEATRLQGAKHRPGVWKCNACRKQFTVTVGTVFEKSKVPLHKWLLATYLLCASKKGMSSHQLHRMLGVTYKTAWFMTHRIREAMSAGTLVSPLGGGGGIVEVDETYWGSEPEREMKRGGTQHKMKIVSLVERDGRARSFHVETVNAKTLKPMLALHILQNSRIMTDEAPWYPAATKLHYNHDSVQHRAGEYSRGIVSTNTVEGFFSIMKRGLIGTYHHVGSQHLGAYLNEFDFRYNGRELTDGERTALALKGIAGKRLVYKN